MTNEQMLTHLALLGCSIKNVKKAQYHYNTHIEYNKDSYYITLEIIGVNERNIWHRISLLYTDKTDPTAIYHYKDYHRALEYFYNKVIKYDNDH